MDSQACVVVATANRPGIKHRLSSPRFHSKDVSASNSNTPSLGIPSPDWGFLCTNPAKWGASLRLAPHFGFFKGFLSYMRGLYKRLTPLKNGIFMTSIPFNCGVFIQADSFQPLSIMTGISRNPDKRNYFFIFRDLTSCEPVLRFITLVIQFLTIGR